MINGVIRRLLGPHFSTLWWKQIFSKTFANIKNSHTAECAMQQNEGVSFPIQFHPICLFYFFIYKIWCETYKKPTKTHMLPLKYEI